MSKAFLGFSVLIVLFTTCDILAQKPEREPKEAVGITEGNRSGLLRQLFVNLRPRSGSVALILGFDTDSSDDAESYTQYYDNFEKQSEKKSTNRTLLLIRKENNVRQAARLEMIASPQQNGWVYLGQARYFESKPRDKNEHLDRLETEGSLKNFGFDYSRVWSTNDISKIGRVSRTLIEKTKAEIDREYRKMPKDEREYHRNISEYEKIGWVGDGYYIADGYWSLIHGGAAWFEARENSRLVNLTKKKLSGNLNKWFSQKEIIDRFAAEFERTRRHDPDSPNNMDHWWSTWKEYLGGKDPDRIPTFTLERHDARTKLMGRVLVDGNTHRSFLESTDFGSAPKKLVRYDNPKIDLASAALLFPGLIDVFISPNESTAFFLTKTEIIATDVSSSQELYREKHELLFSKIVMVEWALGRYVDEWQKKLTV